MVTVMACKQIAIALCVVATLQIYVSASKCGIPSRFWCDSKQTASACGVIEQCSVNEWTLREDAEPVDFVLYYESLCPDCKGFITDMLFPTYEKLQSITNLTLIPYGNAEETKVGDVWQFQCQHGPQECIGNLIATCTIEIVKNITVYFPFLNCMEASNLQPNQSAAKCADQFHVPLKEIFNCVNSAHGNELEHQMALKTNALNPPHTYVPWVTLNGVHTEKIQNEAQNDLKKLLCDTYKGPKPAACS
uniref:Saposin A-type domain-containing protein n=1 Tax=Arion vulgaris TaxID=1028688 RepID=A0A0B7A7L4_9EUPU